MHLKYSMALIITSIVAAIFSWTGVGLGFCSTMGMLEGLILTTLLIASVKYLNSTLLDTICLGLSCLGYVTQDILSVWVFVAIVVGLFGAMSFISIRIQDMIGECLVSARTKK